jgi:hypothetical protein
MIIVAFQRAIAIQDNRSTFADDNFGARRVTYDLMTNTRSTVESAVEQPNLYLLVCARQVSAQSVSMQAGHLDERQHIPPE